MGLVGDIAGAFGISKTGILAWGLKKIGVPDQAAHAISLAAELARGITKDGFDFDKVNKGAVARHALRAFGVESPMATLAATAALKMLPKGFCSGLLPAAGALAAPAVALTALGSLGKMQLGLTSLLTGLASPNDLAGGGMKFLFGNKTAEMRQALGMTRTQMGAGSMVAALPKPAMFEDIVAAFMIDVIKDKQENVEGRLKELDKKDNAGKTAGAQGSGFVSGLMSKIPVVGGFFKSGTEAAQDGNSDSRNIQFEIIKNEIQKLSQMQQAMSNVLNTMHEQAMGAIRHIKA
ncbi:MAG: hypothetical protein IT383_03905 [Deltaproteobacteria bacterium]|nr:hypothetical protein [Deltaproteobacteria bacterium]